MKSTITLFMTCLLMVVGTNIANAQKNGDKVYGFGYAFSTDYNVKALYVSNIVEGIQNSDIYMDATGTDLGNQWHDYFKANVDKSYSYHKESVGFIGESVSSYSQIDQKRNELMGSYRQDGYEIRMLHNFHYHKSKYSN